MSRADDRGLESSRVASWLRDAILDGVREPGSKLIERDLASEFGVSRVPVRDALKVLEAEGLVELRRGRGAVISASAAPLAELADEIAALVRRGAELGVTPTTLAALIKEMSS